ncbi:CPBP family intramembrane metalloprotease [Anaerocolumna sedimenticola]|uniref:CPBP family intramembrane metalloprotease n=1 Tax=Anaerocolumna sedimenticola TaxID=2696063 RepID=A0A6P1TPK1_9FIRM|nr:type II CAAX endopeptidase family protein [Anaerocolumna sedimenticola]QHQ62914.1 CPBP family intramembrane metalloprotease [Anaerocolumna sedimenticola]
MKRNVRKTMKSLSQNHCIIFSAVVIVIALILDPLFVQIFSLLEPGEYLPKIMGQIIPGILILLTIRCILPKQKIGFARKGLLVGIGLGWIFIIYSVINLDISFISQHGIIMPPLATTAGFVIYSISIGFYEEIMMRALILNNFILNWGHTKKGIYKSAILSSGLFGIAHLVNLFYTPDLKIAIMAQIVYATTIGLFFASIYLRSKNIWAVIFLHALFDFAASFKEVFSTAVNEITDITVGNAFAFNLLLLPLAFIGLFLLRKVEPVNIKDEINKPNYRR